MQNQSRFDPSRKTVGAIYRDAQMASHDSHVINEDLTAVMMSSLVEDLNETICDGTKDFEGKPFYIVVHEKKDMQMPRAIQRKMIKMLFRPYPEDDTLVFYVNPKLNDVRFCWCLPHYSEMYNMLNSESLFDHELIESIKAWRRMDLHPFGFKKDELGNWVPNPHWKDKELVEHVTRIRKPLISC